MAITDLTGTTWRLNSVLNFNSNLSQYSLFFTSNGTNYAAFVFVATTPGNYQLIYGSYSGSSDPSPTVYNTAGIGWNTTGGADYQTIIITKGPQGETAASATNSVLIAWLEANAVQVIPPVVISYNGNTIATIDTSGAEILDTEDTYLIDDITIEYTKPAANLQAKINITPATSSQTVTPDSGYDGLSSVQINAMPSGTAGTPFVSKGTVSNNSVAVTPGVTNTTGYITGGTKTGTAVTVSASELVSGTKSITSSGTTDVTNYASASVAAGSATAPSTISGLSASISAGKNTLTLSQTMSVTPTVSAGYVASGTAGNSSVSLTASVTTKSAATYTPTTSNQTIAGGTYLTGAQTILGDANLVPANIASGVTIFNVTGTHSGGTDVSDTTATASDVLTGKYFYTASGIKTQGSIPIYTGANTPG